MKTIWILVLLSPVAALLANLGGCSQKTPDNTVLWPTSQNCDLHKSACETQVGNARVSLEITPHPIPIARPLGVQVTIDNLAVQKMALDISGVNMYMGYNRVPLTSSQSGHFEGTSMLAFCTLDKMQWQLTLLIEQPNGEHIQVPFLLETKNY